MLIGLIKWSRKSNKKRQSRFSNLTKFRGAKEKLKGNVYQVNSKYRKKLNQYDKTTKAILRLVMREFKSLHLLKPTLKDLEEPNIKMLDEHTI